jgi:hypothetical protein
MCGGFPDEDRSLNGCQTDARVLGSPVVYCRPIELIFSSSLNEASADSSRALVGWDHGYLLYRRGGYQKARHS